MQILVVVMFCVPAVFLLYLLLIMPHMIGKPDTSSFRRVLYAHRGLHQNEPDGEGVIVPENSLKAFQKAVDGGYGIEMDVQLSQDGIPVVFHDTHLNRMCGVEGKVIEYTFQELRELSLCKTEEKIPSFAEVLQLVAGKVPLIVEFKADGKDVSVCPIADKLLRDYGGEYCVESFNPLAVFWYKRNRKGVVRGQLSDGFLKDEQGKHPLYFLFQYLLFNWLTKPDFIAYNHKYPYTLSRVFCRRLYRNTAVAWTIKSEEELKEAEKHFDIFIFDSFLPARGSKTEG